MQRPVQSAFQSIEPFELLPNQLSAKMQVSNGFERMVSNGLISSRVSMIGSVIGPVIGLTGPTRIP